MARNVLEAIDQAADIDAIHEFFVNSEPRNAKAEKVKDEWMRWLASLTWYQKHIEDNVLPEAINQKNAFLRANAQSQEELDRITEVLKKTPAFDPVTGRPVTLDSKGDWVKAPEPLIPTQYKMAAIISAAAVATLVILKKLTII